MILGKFRFWLLHANPAEKQPTEIPNNFKNERLDVLLFIMIPLYDVRLNIEIFSKDSTFLNRKFQKFFHIIGEIPIFLLLKKRFIEIMSIERTRLWYAFATHPRHEKKVKSYLDAEEIENYLPLHAAWHKWKDRKRLIETPLFSCYIFVKIEYVYRYNVLKLPSVARIISFNKKPTPIREEEIEEIRLILNSNLDLEVKDGFVEGDAVEIKSGILKGMKGRIIEKSGRNLFTIYIDAVAKSIIVDAGENVVERI